jgi:hypothetical protein
MGMVTVQMPKQLNPIHHGHIQVKDDNICFFAAFQIGKDFFSVSAVRYNFYIWVCADQVV